MEQNIILRLKKEEYNNLSLLADESNMSKVNFIRLSLEFYFKHFIFFKNLEKLEKNKKFIELEKAILNDNTNVEILIYRNYGIKDENFNDFLILMEKIYKGYIINKKRKFLLKRNVRTNLKKVENHQLNKDNPPSTKYFKK